MAERYSGEVAPCMTPLHRVSLESRANAGYFLVTSKIGDDHSAAGQSSKIRPSCISISGF